MKKAVLIGAGQFGRGVIGMLLEQSGYYVTMADINAAVIDDINARGEYTVYRPDSGNPPVTVKNISGMYVSDDRLPRECTDSNLICTCVGLTALSDVAGVIAEAIKLKFSSDPKQYANVLACENAVSGSTRLKKSVLSELDAETSKWAEEHIGFPDCAIDGIIPPVKNAMPADVTAEQYYEWDAMKSSFRGELPDVKGLNAVDDISRYLERKLFTLNGPNAVTGCLGYMKGLGTVQSALEDREVYELVWSMMEDAGKVLSAKHGFSDAEMLEYRSFIMKRFQNPLVIDSCERVAREPFRKLAPNDRIVTVLNYAEELGITVPSYHKGIAAVMAYANPNDIQSKDIQRKIRDHGFGPALEGISGIKCGSRISEAIEREYERLIIS